MKKLIVIGIVATMVMGLASVASAVVDDLWLVTLRAMNANSGANGNISCGTKTGASEGYTTVGSEDAAQSTGSGARAYITSDVTSAVTAVAKDVRGPVVTTKTWNLKVWQIDATGAKIAGDIRVAGWISGIANMTILDGLTVSLVGPFNGADTTPAVFPNGTPATGLGSQASPLFSRTVAYNGVNDVALQLVAVVPEPGSIVALMSGLVGLVGYGIRRRK